MLSLGIQKLFGGIMKHRARTILAGLALLMASATFSGPAQAQAPVKVKIGQPQAGTFQFIPLQVGIETGIFKQHGIDLEIVSFGGGPRVQQALTAGAIDLALGSGPELAFVAKGVPEIGVAALADAPYPLVLAVLKDSPLKTAEDLKGKKISISSNGSLTYWLGRELSRQLGWGSDGIALTPLGTTSAQTAALKTKQIDGMIVEANAGFRLEDDGSGRVLVQFGERIKTFHTYVLYARKDFAKTNPAAVRNFLVGWFDSLAYMRAHRTETIDILKRSADLPLTVATRDYDELMGMFNKTGRFNPKALDVLARSFVEMGLAKEAPDMKTLLTEEFLPPLK